MMQTEIRAKATAWWWSLTIAEQKEMAKKHEPSLRMITIIETPSFVEDIYRAEHGLEPQKRGAAFNQ